MANVVQLSTGATQIDIQRALDALKVSGGTLVLPKNATIEVTKAIGLSLTDKSVSIDMNGAKLVGNGTSNVLYIEAKESALTATTSLSADARGNATITYSQVPSDIKVGSWIKVVSDDALPGDHIDAGDKGMPTRLGQAMQVVSVDGNKVTLAGTLLEQDLYKTNVRTMTYSTAEFSLKNGTIDGGQGSYTTSSNAVDAVHLRNLVGAKVSDLVVEDAGTGVKTVNNVNAEVGNVVAKNVGAGVYSGTSLNTHVDGLFMEHGNHGVIVHGMGTGANDASASRYGANIGLHVTNSVVYDATRSAYDTHSESRATLYQDVLSFDSQMMASFRGIGNSLKDSAGAGNAYGLQFFEYGKGDGRDATVSNVTLRETKNYTFMISGNTLNNKVLDSSFESLGKGYNILSSVVSLAGTTVAEKIVAFDDVLTGTAKADKLLGGLGKDAIGGGAGNDYIWGGADADVLAGGAGRDRFAFNALSEGGDRITDFQAGANGDLIDVSALAARLSWGFGNPLAEGNLRAVASGANTLIEARGTDGTWTTLATLEKVKAASFTAANVQWLVADVNGKSGAAVAAPGAGGPVAGVLPVDAPETPTTNAPRVVSYTFEKSDGTARTGETVTLAVKFSEAVRVEGTGLGLELSNGARASYGYGNGRDTLVFTYKVAAGEDAADLGIAQLLAGGAVVRSVATGLSLAEGLVPANSGGKLLIDTQAPATKDILLSYEDSGLKGDGLTNAKTVTLSGTADAGSRVQIFDGARSLGSALTDANGKWQFDAKWLADGRHDFTGIETDAAGNRGTVSATVSVDIDTKAPGRPTMNGAFTKTATNLGEVPVSGKTEAFASIAIFDNGVQIGKTQADGNGDWSFRAEGLSTASHRLSAVATDAAGNSSGASQYRDVVVDRTGPEVALTRMAVTGADGAVQFRGTVNETPSEIAVYDNGKLVASQSTSYANWLVNLQTDAKETHTFTFAAKDAAGNTGAMPGVAVLGSRGNDVVVGSAHDDWLTGNGGTDTFAFGTGAGRDVVTDFRGGSLGLGGDVLKFDASLFASFANVMGAARQVGSDVVITADDHSAVTLQRMTLASLTHENVLLV